MVQPRQLASTVMLMVTLGLAPIPVRFARAADLFDGSYVGTYEVEGWFNAAGCYDHGRGEIHVMVAGSHFEKMLSLTNFSVDLTADGAISASSSRKAGWDSVETRLIGKISGQNMELEWKNKYCSFHASLQRLPSQPTQSSDELVAMWQSQTAAQAPRLPQERVAQASPEKRALPQTEHNPQTGNRVAALIGPEHREVTKSAESGPRERQVGAAVAANSGRVAAPEKAPQHSDEPVAATANSALMQQHAVTPSSSASVSGSSTTASSVPPIVAVVARPDHVVMPSSSAPRLEHSTAFAGSPASPVATTPIANSIVPPHDSISRATADKAQVNTTPAVRSVVAPTLPLTLAVPTPVVQPVVVPALPPPQPVQIENTVVVNLTQNAAELRGLITMFNAMIEEQRKIAADNAGLSDVALQSVAVLQERVMKLQAQFLDTTTELSHYQTSIKPNDPDLQITARKASEIYPKVPYYIPGTPETGDFWIEPFVTDTGELMFNLKFIDPKAEHDPTRGTIPMGVSDVETTQKALLEIVKWSKIAHENHIRRTYTQRAACFPTDKCPAENGPKRDGMASTEIDFKVYEDGSTAGRIQRNKGLFEDGYNISIESALMLQAYMSHILTEGKTEFQAGSRTDEQMRDLFKQ